MERIKAGMRTPRGVYLKIPWTENPMFASHEQILQILYPRADVYLFESNMVLIIP